MFQAFLNLWIFVVFLLNLQLSVMTHSKRISSACTEDSQAKCTGHFAVLCSVVLVFEVFE